MGMLMLLKKLNRIKLNASHAIAKVGLETLHVVVILAISAVGSKLHKQLWAD